MVIGRQVPTEFGGRIDLLAIDSAGALTILELKRDRTPREVVAQLIDYASWVNRLSTRQVHEMATTFLNRPLYSVNAKQKCPLFSKAEMSPLTVACRTSAAGSHRPWAQGA